MRNDQRIYRHICERTTPIEVKNALKAMCHKKIMRTFQFHLKVSTNAHVKKRTMGVDSLQHLTVFMREIIVEIK